MHGLGRGVGVAVAYGAEYGFVFVVEFGKRTRLPERPAPLGCDDIAPSVHAGHEAIVACPQAPGVTLLRPDRRFVQVMDASRPAR